VAEGSPASLTAADLIETKFHRPRAHGLLVARPRLRDQMRAGSSAALTLVSAPAGFGKTTLMAAAADDVAPGTAVAWLSLDSGDNDPVTFWTYVAAALDRAVPGVGRRAVTQLETAQVSIEVALTSLLNDLAAAEADVELVLDDLHVLEDPVIHEGLMFVLDHLPARIHVTAGTRADPPMPLSRLRARGALVEVRAADLRFTTDEAASYLHDSMGLPLDDSNVAALESRTEGWIAALQLAALSMQGRDDLSAFIDRFAGDDRHIVDYLAEEVLARQPPDRRDFLLRTSILARMTGPLADAVSGRAGGRATLESLDRANLFVFALDDQRRWYRYHHLFGDALRANLVAERPDEIPELHRLAGEWFEAAGDRSEAIRHLLAGRHHERAAELIELAVPEMGRTRRERTLRAWMEGLPDDLFDARPVLSVGYVGALMSTGAAEGAADLLGRAERWVGTPPDAARRTGMVVADEAQYARLPGAIELYRAALAKLGGDLEGNMRHARRLLEVIEPDDHLGRGGGQAFLGLAYWELGELQLADRWYADSMVSLELADHLADVVGGSITLADLRLAQGRLRDAGAVYERELGRATRDGEPFLRGVADMHVGLADVAYFRGDLAAAETHLAAAERLGEEQGFPRYPYRSRLARARLAAAHGELDRALELFGEAERRYVGDFSPDVRPIAAQRVRVLIAHGRLGEARTWARTRGIGPTDEALFAHEYELLTLARLLTGEGAATEAVELTGRLLAAAEHGDRGGSILEARIVDALARHAAGDLDGAIASLDRAIALAEPEGYVRTFLDEGPPMTALLKAAVKRRVAPPYVRALLAAGGPSPRPDSRNGALVEPLSERELEVLRLLRSELDGPGMARELVVSLNTLRTHTKNIYAKLGVTSRRSAIRRAEELGLL
jgi:LuxR family maltose regulon positive regulatory protein